VRSSEVCRAWRQAASSAEPWELLYAKSWGDTELVAGCDTLRASYRSRYAMLVALPPLLCEWGECAERVERTTAAERLDHLATAQRCAESLLGCVRHLSKALEALSRDNGGGQVPDAADSALADIPIPLSVLKGRCIGRRPGEVRKTPHFRALVLVRCCGQVQRLRHTTLRVAMVLLTAWRPRRSDARQRTQRGWRGT
jgi:hypothetical protein